MNDKLFELTISVEALKIHEIDGKVGNISQTKLYPSQHQESCPINVLTHL